MSDANAPAGQVAPAAPVQAQQPAPAPAPSNGPKVGDLPDEALAKRLERERETAQRDLLKQLGVTDVKGAAEAMAELKRRQDAERSELDRVKAEADALRAKAARADQQEPVIKARADAEMASLTEAQRAAVVRLAGDDPARTLSTITELRVGGLLPAVGASATTTTAEPPKPVPAPASTAAPAPPAPQPNPAPTPNHLATYQDLEKRNPVAAAHYYLAHASAIQAAQQQRT